MRFAEKHGGTLYRGGRIVEFVGESGGEFAKREHFGGAFLVAGGFTGAVGHFGDEFLREVGGAINEFAKLRGGHGSDARAAYGNTASADEFHPREWQYPGGLTCGANENGRVGIVGPSNVHFTFENDVELLCGRAFLDHDFAGLEAADLEILREPFKSGAVVVGKERDLREFIGREARTRFG